MGEAVPAATRASCCRCGSPTARSPRPTRCSAWSSKLLDLAGGRTEASAVLDLIAAEPVRRRFGFAENDLETITQWVEQAGVRWSYDEQHRCAVRAGGLRPEHLALRPRPGARGRGDVRRRRALDRYDAAARRRRVHQHRARRPAGRAGRPAAARHRPAHRQPPGRPLAGHAARGDRVAHRGRPRRRVADRPGAARAGRVVRRRRSTGGRARAAPARRTRADVRAPRRAADPGQLPHRHADRLHDGADAVGAAPRGLPARAGRRRLPPRTRGRRRRRARAHPAHRRARPAQRGPAADARRDPGRARAAGGHLQRGQRDDRPAAPARRTPRRAARRPRRHRRRAGASTRSSGTRCRRSTRATCSHRCRSPSTAQRSPEPRAAAGTRVPVPSLAGAPLPAARRTTTSSSARWSRSSGTRSGRSSAAASGSPCSTRATRSPTGCRSSSTTCRSGRSATGCCATCCAAATPEHALATEWRRGVLPPGRLGWRLGQRLTPGGQPGRRDGRVGHPGAGAARGRRRRRPRRRTQAPRHRHRPVRRTHRDRDLLPARPAAVARGLDPAARPVRDPSRPALVGGCDRQGREGPLRRPRRRRSRASPSPASTRRPTCCATWWRCTTPASASRSRSR